MFSSIIGHEKTIEKLSNHLKKDPAGTYLFFGPPSVGKRTVAFEASKAILCDIGTGEDFCLSCKKFNDSHPDFLSIGQHERIKVADVDSIIEFSETTPLLSNHKAIVIDNAHEITWEAANRLLKLLEEPPSTFIFFLVSSEPQSIISTILSRCIKYEFGSLTREDATNIIWKKLGFDLPQATMLGWMVGDSSMDIFSRPGQYLNYREMAFDLLSGIKYKALSDSMDFIDKIEKRDLPIFIDMLMLVLTDFLLIKNGILNVASSDKIEEYQKTIKDLNGRALVGVANLFSQLKRDARLNVNLNLNLKNVLIKAHPLFLVPA